MSAGAYLFPGNGVLRALRVVSKGFYQAPGFSRGVTDLFFLLSCFFVQQLCAMIIDDGVDFIPAI